MAPEELSLEDALAADIDAAFKEQETATADVEEEVSSQYVRDEAGRFAKKQAEEEAAAAEAAPEAPEAAAPVEGEQKPPASAWRPLWHKNEMGEWEKLPEPLRKAIEQREREAAQGIERHSTAAKAWEPVAKALEPYQRELAAAGTTPQAYVSNLINADKYLREDPVAAMNWLAQTYLGTDIYGVAEWMQQQNYQAGKVDPVQQELAALRQKVSELSEAPVRQQREMLQQEIAAWSQDKPYFADLREYMAALARTAQYKGATLDQLYEAAQYAHPALRERILEDQRKREVAAARARGAQSPRGTPDEGAQPRKASKRQTVEDAVKEAFDEAGI